MIGIHVHFHQHLSCIVVEDTVVIGDARTAVKRLQ